jgi:hypothetical protein
VWEAKAKGKIGAEPPDLPSIRQAVEKYLSDAESRRLAPETVCKRREHLDGKLIPYCQRLGSEPLRRAVDSQVIGITSEMKAATPIDSLD